MRGERELSSRGAAPRYAGTLSAFGAIAAAEGVGAGLYRGAAVTIFRASVLSGSQLASYDTLKRAVKRAGVLDEGPALHLACSLASKYALSARQWLRKRAR